MPGRVSHLAEREDACRVLDQLGSEQPVLLVEVQDQGEQRGSGLVRPCFPVRPRSQLSFQEAEFACWERAENRFRRERRRAWWLAQQGIEAGPSPVLSGVVGR